MSDEFAVGDRVIINYSPGRWAEKVEVTGTIINVLGRSVRGAYIEICLDEKIGGNSATRVRLARDIRKVPQ